MNSGGPEDVAPSNGGEYLLSLLQGSRQKLPTQYKQVSESSSSVQSSWQNGLQQRLPPAIDPAVAELGPAVLFHLQHGPRPWQLNPSDLTSQQNVHPSNSAFPAGAGLLPRGISQTASHAAGSHLPGNQQNLLQENLFRLGFPHRQSTQQHMTGGSWSPQFGSVPEPLPGFAHSVHEGQVDSMRSVHQSTDFRRYQQSIRPPPGFTSGPRGRGMGMGVGNGGPTKEFDRVVASMTNNEDILQTNGVKQPLQVVEMDPQSVDAFLAKLNIRGAAKYRNPDRTEESNDGEVDLEESSAADDESTGKRDPKHQRSYRDKEVRADSRGQTILHQRMRFHRSRVRCRANIDKFNDSFLSIFESLIPLEEDQAKQKQLFERLEKIVIKEWPDTRLYLYGSCANSFGVCKSDIDVCLAIDPNLEKSEVLLKLSDMLQSENFQNVQALTRARVPIVKLMDPATGFSCDICINNLLAVVNTKLLRDYGRIDARLQQLAFIVKHWAKSRAVNETYHGTLSSYAYVLMSIHFLQAREPPILPCLQGMQPTYAVTVDDIDCSFFDKIEQLNGYGFANKERIASLVWGFFHYWAYCHDYTNDVISVRTGSLLSKREKDWTRRVGNDRHLICIEDPFETSHDLGRVVDKFSIRVLREEFERAAEIMQFDPNPCLKLFEPYKSG